MPAKKHPIMIDGVEHWKCPSCEAVKPYTEFYKTRHSRTGLYSYCKPCQNLLASSYAKRRNAVIRRMLAEAKVAA